LCEIWINSFQHGSFTYQPRESRYVLLDDGRKLCLECLDSAVMDTNECQPLYLEIQEFYEGLNMKVEQQVPLLLVERQALNEAMEGEKAVCLLCSNPKISFSTPLYCSAVTILFLLDTGSPPSSRNKRTVLIRRTDC